MGKTLEEMGIAPVAANNLIMGDLEGDIVNMRQAGTMGVKASISRENLEPA